MQNYKSSNATAIYQKSQNSDRQTSPSRDLKHYLGKQSSPRGRRNTSPVRERYQAKKAAEEALRYHSTNEDDVSDEPEDYYLPQPKAKAMDLQQISEEASDQVSESVPLRAIRLDRSFESSVSRQYMETI